MSLRSDGFALGLFLASVVGIGVVTLGIIVDNTRRRRVRIRRRLAQSISRPFEPLFGPADRLAAERAIPVEEMVAVDAAHALTDAELIAMLYALRATGAAMTRQGCRPLVITKDWREAS